MTDLQRYAYRIVNGKALPRVRFGEERNFYSGTPTCRDCGVKVGELHHPACCIERCPVNGGGQVLSCSCPHDCSTLAMDADGRRRMRG